MSPQPGATALQPIEVVVDCEACGQPFTYLHELLGTTRSLYGLGSSGSPGHRVDQQVERLRAGDFSDLPPRACPHCGALQSWMMEAANRQQAERWGCGVALATATLGLAILAFSRRFVFDPLSLIAVLLASLALGAAPFSPGVRSQSLCYDNGAASSGGCRPPGTGAPMDYRIGNDLDLDTVIELYRLSTLGERRPIGDRGCMQRMLEEANLVVTAWDGADLVGISRSLTDFCYVAYLADLAVRASHQRQGVGRELIRRTREALGPEAMIVLLAAPAAVDYYAHVGFEHHPQAWILRPGPSLST